jgi:exonuclease V gamma subunit
METKLNDNEVKEIVKMQQKIDSYEGFIRATFIMAKRGAPVNYPLFKDTGFTDEMFFIWKTIKEKCVNNEGT